MTFAVSCGEYVAWQKKIQIYSQVWESSHLCQEMSGRVSAAKWNQVSTAAPHRLFINTRRGRSIFDVLSFSMKILGCMQWLSQQWFCKIPALVFHTYTGYWKTCMFVIYLALDTFSGKINSESLHLIETSIFILCLDGAVENESGLLRDDNCLARQMLHGHGSHVNSCNRWYDKTMQVWHYCDVLCS